VTKFKVAVAMSGGIDSSVAAALLKEQGCRVTGVTMKIWGGNDFPGEGTGHGCYGPGEAEDIEDARRIARLLGIDFHVLDLRDEYRAEVLDYFCQEYLSGRTPNPCLRCNQRVKFDALLRQVLDSGIEFDYFATGHYAQVEYDRQKQRYLLKKARDGHKDQSYFLSFLSQAQLGRSIFPVGRYSKEEVRNMAAGFGLAIDNKPESQDFITGGYSTLIETTTPGPILDREGNTLGEHHGISFYTVGQRKRLGISARIPLYVTGIDPEKNAVIIGGRDELYHDGLIASGMNWIAIPELKEPITVKARIRNTHSEAEATVTPLSQADVYVKYKEPQMALTPGQAVAFYQGDVLIGGGTIERIETLKQAGTENGERCRKDSYSTAY